ncbi:MAG: SDR family NAD(P)-dependent oxidoreductase, partial [Acutalibacteraceae bacterium]
MKRVLVTGGSRGIGAAAVRLFAADGRQVIANYCGSEEQARALAAETGCLLCRADVSDSDGRSALLAFADEALGGVDVLVTEQYPKGLGGTVPEIAELLPESCPPIAKTGFSAFVEPAFRTALAAKPRKTLVVA